MARKITDQNLQSRDARAKLQVRNAPYWCRLSAGLMLGYRRSSKKAKAGSWIAKWDQPGTEGRSQSKLGIADDMLDADGSSILSFDQAQEKARDWRGSLARASIDGPSGPYTVRDAMSDYMSDYEGRSDRSTDRMNWTSEAHILPKLGDIELKDLTRAKLRKWHRDLAKEPARLRTKIGAEQQHRVAPSTPDDIRKRQSAANRVRSLLFAALNLAYREGQVDSDDAWASVAPFKNVDAPKIRYLTDAESTRLVNACPSDLRAIVTGALLTGARYGELAALVVSDFDPNANTLHIARSKSGKARNIVLTEEGHRFFEQAVTGKKSSDLVFSRSAGGAWGRAHQTRPLKEACDAAKIDPAISFHVLRHTYGSRLAMKGAPMAVIAAQLGHADTRMTEKHYAHLAPSYVADTVRAAFGELGIVEESNVAPLKPSADL